MNEEQQLQKIEDQRKGRQKDSLDYQLPNRLWYHIDHIYKMKNGLYCPPIQVEVSPTSMCNQKCRFCYTYKREDANMLDEKVLMDFFSHAADMGIETIYICGTGEPLLNKALPDAICAGGKTGIKMGLNTNGTLFDEQKQQKTLDSLLYVKFSVIDNDAKRYANNHRCSASLHHTLVKNIEHATNYRSRIHSGVSLFATMYVDGNNFHDAYEIVKFSKSLGLDFVCMQGPATFTEFSPDGRKDVLICDSKEQIDELKERVLTLEDDEFKVFITFSEVDNKKFQNKKLWRKNFCRTINLVGVISGDGEVYPCWRAWGNHELSYGNLHDQSFEDIWKGPRRQEVNEYIYSTPPSGDECEVCKTYINNVNLDKILNNTNKWRYIL